MFLILSTPAPEGGEVFVRDRKREQRRRKRGRGKERENKREVRKREICRHGGGGKGKEEGRDGREIKKEKE